MSRVFWALFALTTALYLAMTLWSLPQLSALAGGQAMFDLRPSGYDLTTARTILDGLGAAGRDFYLRVQQPLDALFPPLEALVLSLAFLRLYSRAVARPLILLAIAAAAFDLMENVGVATMLRAGPDGVSAEMVAVASRWSVMKSASVTFAMLALLAGLAMAGWRRWRPVTA